MVGINEQPTNSVGQFKISGGVALKIGSHYYTTGTDGNLKSSGALPADIDDGDNVGEQS